MSKFLAAVMLIFLGAVPLRAADRPYAQMYDSLAAVQRSTDGLVDTEKSVMFARSFDDLLARTQYSRGKLAEVTDGELGALFSAADMALFYSSRTDDLEIMQAVMNELERRGRPTKLQYRSLYGALIQTRMFTRAKALYKAHPDFLDALPALETSRVQPPSVLVPDKIASKLVLKHLDITGNAFIVVVTHPYCHFSRNAFAAIESDPTLARIFSTHSALILPPARNLDLRPVQEWNSAHSRLPMSIAFSKNEWPYDMSWETPTFYFYRDGKLVRKIQGWQSQEKRVELVEAAAAIGLD